MARADSDQTQRAPAGARERSRRRVSSVVARGARLVAVLYVFIGALQVLKAGAEGMAVLNEGGALVNNAFTTLGLGWIGAMFTLSGSTMTTAALTLRATGSISEVQGFTMVTGARLGAAFVVLLVASIYAFRNNAPGRKKPVSTAVLALVITAVIYLPGAMIGLMLLRTHAFGSVRLQAPPEFGGLIDVVYEWILVRIDASPPALLFAGGVVLLVFSFKFLDALVPHMDQTRLQGRMSWLRSKWPMFFLGFVVVIATLSVSVALTVLVPLVAKGYVKREHLIPYIIGADLGTLVDKLLIAFVVGAGATHASSPPRIIIAELVGTCIIGLIMMVFFYIPLRRAVWRFQRMVTKNEMRLAVFTACLFATPLTIIALSQVAG